MCRGNTITQNEKSKSQLGLKTETSERKGEIKKEGKEERKEEREEMKRNKEEAM